MRYSKIKIFAFVLSALIGSSALAQGNSANAPGKNRNLGHDNASDGIKGKIVTNHGIVYSGDPLDISVKFPRGSELIANGEVDAWIVVYAPDAVTMALPVSDLASTEARKVFAVDAVDVADLAEGVYQLGLVLTIPGGDPLQIADWYNGLLGLVSVQGVTVSASELEVDEDSDGEVDGDEDGDGFVDEEPTDGDDTTGDDTTGDDTTGDDATGDDTTGDDTTGGDTTDGDTTGGDTTGGDTTGDDTTV